MAQPNSPWTNPTWTYNAQLIDAKRKKQLADALSTYEMNKGGVTNPGGFFAGGANGLDVLGAALTSYMSGKQGLESAELAKQAEQGRVALSSGAAERYNTPSQAELDLAKSLQNAKPVQKSYDAEEAMQYFANQPMKPLPQELAQGIQAKTAPAAAPPVQPVQPVQPVPKPAQAKPVVPAQASYSNEGRNHPASQGMQADGFIPGEGPLDRAARRFKEGLSYVQGALGSGLQYNKNTPNGKVAPAPVAPAASGALARAKAAQASQAAQAPVAPSQPGILPPPGGPMAAPAAAPVQAQPHPFQPGIDEEATMDNMQQGALQMAMLAKQRQNGALADFRRAGRDDIADSLAFSKNDDKITTGKPGEYIMRGGKVVGQLPPDTTVNALKPSDKISLMKIKADDAKQLEVAKQTVTRYDTALASLNDLRKNLGDVATGPWASVGNTIMKYMPGEYGSKVKAVRSWFTSAAFQQARADLLNNISDTDARAYLSATPDDSWQDAQIFEYANRFEDSARAQKKAAESQVSAVQQNLRQTDEMLGNAPTEEKPAQRKNGRVGPSGLIQWD